MVCSSVVGLLGYGLFQIYPPAAFIVPGAILRRRRDVRYALMGLLKSLSPRGVTTSPRAAGDTGTMIDLTDPNLVEFLRGGLTSESGAIFTPEGALRVTTAYRCANILSSAVKSMPLDFKRSVDPKTRVDADDHPLWPVLQVKPNSWQTPSEFKSMMQLGVLLRGNGYALKVRSLGKI
jgi:hypothetical protein